jgi:hypothetical protein
MWPEELEFLERLRKTKMTLDKIVTVQTEIRTGYFPNAILANLSEKKTWRFNFTSPVALKLCDARNCFM